MTTTPLPTSFLLLEDSRHSGPHSLAVIKQKAEIHVIKPDTPIRPATPADAPWTTIRDWPELHDLLFPARTAPKLRGSPDASAKTTRETEHDATDVFQLLRINAAYESIAEAGQPTRVLKKPGGRRRRDFWVVVIVANALAATYTGLLAGFGPIQLVLVLGFASILTVGLYWVMFHIMDPY